MPIRGELVVPAIGRDVVEMDSDLLVVAIFCMAGLVLSFALIAYTDSFEQIADLAGTCLWG